MRRPRKTLSLALLTVTLAVALTTAAPGLAVEPQGANPVERIRIVDNRFRNGTITIERGTVVKWVNRGNNPHTSTSTDGVWDSGTLTSGDSFRRRFRRVGTFDYMCVIHPSMTGTITVVA
jgi:plastocyanin